MADGDDLDDTEFESIYGRAMMLARLLAAVEALERKFAAQAQSFAPPSQSTGTPSTD